jgi:cell division protein FtsW
MLRLSKIGHRPDYFLLTLILILTIGGLVILASASSELGKSKFDDSYYYLKHQILNGLVLGILGFLVTYKLHYQLYRRLAFFMLLANIGLLVLVFIPGFGVTGGGATRWIRVGPALFQPAELLKLTYIIYLAAWLTNPKWDRAKEFTTGLIPFFVVTAVVGGLLLLQPATSTVFILVASGGIMYFLSGARYKHILILGAVCAAAFALVILITPYRMQRILNFFKPHADVQGSGYQLNQALIAMGSGGIWGVGYGQSTAKVNSLPTPTDDSIFAVAAQELGFVGAGAIVILFAMTVFRLMWTARHVRDKFGQVLLVGFAAIIGLQSLVNMGAISGFFPLTGVPLPFISYGGTALAVFLTISGISLNISKYT